MSRRFLLLALIAGLLAVGTAYAGDEKDTEDVQRKSGTSDPVASYPLPFNLSAANPNTQPAVSTGYYFVDSDDEASDFWRPDPSLFVDTLTEPATWHRIVSGPNQYDPSYWNDGNQNTFGGHAYFRNPGDDTDSTDDAFAGPISIGFPFYFNGVRYDSFYVSTNGLIALSNRRYFYEFDNNGFPDGRTSLEVEPGVFSSYDPMSDDLRNRLGDGLGDPTADDYGYRYIATGDVATNATKGIRTRDNSMLDENSLRATEAWPTVTIGGDHVRPPLIAPAWDDMQLSVFDSVENKVDDFGRAYYKRSPDNDKLIIYYVNLTPIRAKRAVVDGVTHNVTFVKDNRPGSHEHYRLSLQVTLNRNDSSVTIQYERFFGNAPRTALRPYAATVWMRCNSTVGVTGPSRRLNWGGFPNTMPTSTTLDYDAPKYTQSTEYLFNVNTHPLGGIRATSKRSDDNSTPKDFLAITFKQWKNYLRVISVYYQVHPLDNNKPLDFSVVIPAAMADNYELLAGDDRLGTVQSVIIVQNLTTDIQGPDGVNYQEQGVNFKVRMKIKNESTGKTVYNTSKVVSDANLLDTTMSGVVLCDIDGNALPYTPGHFVKPYEFVRVTLPPYSPAPFIDDQMGRLITSVIAEPKDSLNNALDGQWPFDDTTSIRLFKMRRLNGFNDNVNEFHLVGGVAMPSTLKWVNLGSDVVDGDEVTNNPPPPRGTYKAANSDVFSLKSPVIRMNRVDLDGRDIPPVGQYGGDELRSFPINLTNKGRAVLSISYQRAGKLSNIGRGFSDNRLVGPEHQINLRTVTGFQPGLRKPDKLMVEFATPSNDQINGITNIKHWVYDPANLGRTYLQPIQIWGGGGAARGFSITDYNKQLTNSPVPPEGGIREDLFDDGKDYEYYKVTLPIPDSITNWENEGARNFRFRLKVEAMNNSTPPFPPDDADDFFIDNVKILFPDETTDIEFANISLTWPYTLAPASQVTKIPITVKIANNTDLNATAFSVRVQIKPKGNENQQIYCRTITVPTLRGNREILLPFPSANFRRTTPGRYKVTGRIFFPGNDLDTLNDSTFTTFEIQYGDSFAYEENPNNPQNDVPRDQFSGVYGRGLNLGGSNSGGADVVLGRGLAGPVNQYTQDSQLGSFPSDLTPDDSYGAVAGNASGQIAMRFTLFTQDTVYGYKAYWAELNPDILNISFSLYRDQGGVPGQRINNSTMIRRRGEDELGDDPEFKFGEYVTYLLDEPVVLPPGEYWVSVAQLGTEGYELGASGTRMGMVTTLYSDIPAPGTANRTLMIDKNFRVRSRSGVLFNDNRFAFEKIRFSGDWVPFMSTIGNPGYPHLNAMGTIQGYPTFTRGTWIPLLRPYFGNRTYSEPPVYVDCIVPVELTYFDGRSRSSGVDLFWETASEKNNQGFNIERRAMEETTDLLTGTTGLKCVDQFGDSDWSRIGFVPGAGNTTETLHYKFFDEDITSGLTYQYRLRQVDFDGSESFSNVVNVVFSDNNVISLEDNAPNPTSERTLIRFRVPYRANVRLEIFDMMGNRVRTLYDDVVAGQNGNYAIEWNGRDQSGYDVSSGSYMYKLTAGENVVSKTLTIVR